MNISLQGKRALVTGAGKGIGREIVKVLHECGCAEIVAISRTKEDLDSLAKEFPGVKTIAADLVNAKTAREAAEQAGPIDLLVNNAGISIPQPLLETTVEAFDKTIAVTSARCSSSRR